MLAVYFHTPHLPGRGIRHEGMDYRAHQLFHRKSEQLGQAAVGTENPTVRADDQIGIRRILKQIAIPRFTVLEAIFGPHPLQFGGRTGGKNPEQKQTARLRGHGSLVECG